MTMYGGCNGIIIRQLPSSNYRLTFAGCGTVMVSNVSGQSDFVARSVHGVDAAYLGVRAH